MQRQNVEQAEQLVAEVLVAACLAAAADEGSAKERRVVRELLRCAFDTLCARRISVHAQVGGREVKLPCAQDGSVVKEQLAKFLMRKRGRQVVLDRARLQSHATLLTIGEWCRSALRSNLRKAFKILGHTEFC
ncbi:hypothetical protein ACI2OW_00300 [Pseudomonas shirazica]|uniref:hypothetical protein n=1 Tax=Pseudomonas TaxID=286 RepID=UPI0038539F7A